MNSCFAQFFYRFNSDKTVEAICGFCFAASHPVSAQADLQAWEKAHVCSEKKQPPGVGAPGPTYPASAKAGRLLLGYVSQP